MGINFSKVGFTYNPQKKTKKNQYILEDVDLNISEKDEFICVVGHTGSGKSTLIQMTHLCKLLAPDPQNFLRDRTRILSKPLFESKVVKNIPKD